MTPDRSHLSIGEVLSLLQDEFPDVTISKIRFLESQGLIDPERTPSGYRKFYEGDIDILRWILLQQREKFLPLKVIKDRLDESGGKVPPGDAPEPATEAASAAGMAAATAPAGAVVDALPFAPDPPTQASPSAPAAEPVPAPAAEAPSPAATKDADQPVWMQDHARRQAAKDQTIGEPAPRPPLASETDVSSVQ
ncbi:MAG: MerR family transcriptional regulator, partial [Acidimicrobiales bacterium]